VSRHDQVVEVVLPATRSVPGYPQSVESWSDADVSVSAIASCNVQAAGGSVIVEDRSAATSAITIRSHDPAAATVPANARLRLTGTPWDGTYTQTVPVQVSQRGNRFRVAVLSAQRVEG